MANTILLTQSSTEKALSNVLSAAPEDYARQPFVRPGDSLQVISSSDLGGFWTNARWGLKVPAVSPQIITTTPFNRVLSKPKLKILVRRHRCVVPVNCFCAEKKDEVFLIRLLSHRLFGLGGILNNDRGKSSFSLLTTDAPDILKPICSSIPVLFPLEKKDRWLEDRPLDDLFYLADKSVNYWFDYFKVSPLVMSDASDKNLLKPLGLSFQEIKNRDEKLKALRLKALRANRSGKG